MRAAALTLRAVPRLALALPRRLRFWALVLLFAAGVLGGVYYGWFRDSSLVQVEDVTVTGLTGPDAERLRKRLTEAGLQMTTLHVREEDLRRAVESEPAIRAIAAKPDFPHGLRIDVTENHPVAAVNIPGSGRVPVAGNGTLLPGLQSKASVPEILVDGSPRPSRAGTQAARLTDAKVAPLIRVAGSAPPALLHRAEAIERRRGEGIVVVLRDGPRVIFGDDADAAAKWTGAAGVLASRQAQGAAYVDVRLPERPVAGGLGPQASAGGAATDPAAAPVDPAAAATGDPATVPAPESDPAVGTAPEAEGPSATPSTTAGGSPTADPAGTSPTPAPAPTGPESTVP